jgi:hypothetical protein
MRGWRMGFGMEAPDQETRVGFALFAPLFASFALPP